MDEDPDVYGTWLRKYSEAGDPEEAATNVREEVDQLLKEGVPLEVRVAALETYITIWTDFMLSMFYVDQVQQHVSKEFVIDRGTLVAEFLYNASLVEAIKLHRLANEGEG
jgi:hypothetical protein